MRSASGRKRVGDAQDDETPAFGGIEDAGAIRKCAGFAAEFAHLPVLEVEYFDGLDRLRDFLSVGAHVLHRCAADTAWNAAQALDPGAPGSDRMGDEAIP